MEIKSSTIWNILTVLVLAATGVVLFVYGIIFFFPNNPINFLAPAKPPAVVVLPSATATLAKLPATNTVEPNLFVSATLRPSETSTLTITPTEPTATITLTSTASLTPTITGTPPTTTPTATFTIAPAVKTSWAQTYVAQTKTAAAAQTSQALTSAASRATDSVKKTQNAAATQTQVAGNATATQNTIATATAQDITATAEVYHTATAVAATATQVVVNTQQAATITQIAQATRDKQATIENNQPIAYSITGGDADAEYFVTKKPSSGAAGSTLYSLDLSTTVYGSAQPVNSWWLGDTDNHYLLFSDPTILNPIHRMLYTTTGTVEQIDTGLSGQVLQPSVDVQAGNAEDRNVVFTYALAPGQDRNLWTVQGNGNSDGGVVLQISADGTKDDHDPSWVSNSMSSFYGRVIYVSSRGTGSENIYVMSPNESSYPGTQLTFYDVATTEINSPRWCHGYDWEAEEYYDIVVYAMRTAGSDDWDLYSIDPSNQIATGDNEDIIDITTSDSGVDETQPDWSPFCNRITYISNSGGQTDVWTMNADGTNPVKLTDTAAIEARPLWMPYKDGMVMP